MPHEMYELFVSNSTQAINFRRNIRALNCIFSFTSFGAKIDKELASARRGVYTFRAQGMVYHELPGLHPNDNGPTNFQLYFIDTDKEIDNRMSILDNADLSEELITKVAQILESNPYAKIFRSLKDYPSMDNVQLHLSKDVNLDQRVYNSPTADQVAAVWVEGNDPQVPVERDIVIHAHSGHRHKIKHYYGCCDPLQYPILLPLGDTGWRQGIPKMSVRESTSPSTQTINREGQRGEFF